MAKAVSGTKKPKKGRGGRGGRGSSDGSSEPGATATDQAPPVRGKFSSKNKTKAKSSSDILQKVKDKVSKVLKKEKKNKNKKNGSSIGNRNQFNAIQELNDQHNDTNIITSGPKTEIQKSLPDDQVDVQADGFIAFDSDFSDVAESIHTTFQAFEDELDSDDGDGDNYDNDSDNNDNNNADTSGNNVDNVDLSPETSVPKPKSLKRKGGRPYEGAYDDSSDHSSKKLSAISSEYPWVVNHDHSSEKEIADWLTLEIKDFVAYMSPSAEEIRNRNNAVRRIRSLVNELWNDAETHVFGSFATDLYLPGSDIDMVILSKSGKYDTRQHLYKLSSKLRSSGIATNMEVIAKARVPIIKFVEKTSKIHMDISFERQNGVQAVDIIKEWNRQFPCLRHFAIVVKHFLARRRLNEVHSGGLGGFSVICLIVSFLKNHPRIASRSIDPLNNLGVLLIEFFELYGRNFNYNILALSMTGEMPYLRKGEHRDLETQKEFSLAIQDPKDPSNNLSRGSFNIHSIKKAFSGAFDMLIARCYELEFLSFKDRVGKSILGHVIKFRGPERDFIDSRKEVQKEYIHVVHNRYQDDDEVELEIANNGDDIVIPSDFEQSVNDSDGSVYVEKNVLLNDSLKVSTKSSTEAATIAPSEIWGLHESDSDVNIGNSPSAPITFYSDDEGDSESDKDSRVSQAVIDKNQKRDYWLSKRGI